MRKRPVVAHAYFLALHLSSNFNRKGCAFKREIYARANPQISETVKPCDLGTLSRKIRWSFRAAVERYGSMSGGEL